MKYLVILVLTILLFSASYCSAESTGEMDGTIAQDANTSQYIELNVSQVKDLIASEPNLVIIDVSPYYSEGHIPGAISIPLASLEANLSMLDMKKPHLVYCHGDAPSIAGAETLIKAGLTPVYRLVGNFAAWKDSGSPITDGVIPEMGASGYTNTSVDLTRDLIATQKDLVIIDVSPYYKEGHIPGAMSIPLDTLEGNLSMLDMKKPYLVYCHGDVPSIAGAETLVKAKFSPVYRLVGNYDAWITAGYPIEK